MGTGKRISKFLPQLLGELGLPPTYFLIDEICSRMRHDVPPLSLVLESLTKLGYKAASTHFHPKAIKTDAPIQVLTTVVEDLQRKRRKE
jgi:tRNA (guanine26-N2/guanine27-N2)-dimethyltransferase